MKKLIIITLVTAVGIGSSLQAGGIRETVTETGKPDYQNPFKKTSVQAGTTFNRQVVRPTHRTFVAGGLMQPTHIKDPKKMERMIRELRGNINETKNELKGLLKDRFKAAKQGKPAQVRKLNVIISDKNSKLNRFNRQLKQYELRLATLKKLGKPQGSYTGRK